jgi:hypothetical protein
MFLSFIADRLLTRERIMSPLVRFWKHAAHEPATPKTAAKRRPRARCRPHLEALEDRVVPTAYVFVDFGDNFPVSGTNRVLTTTVGAVRDVATTQLDNNNNPIANTVIQGPQLTDANDNNYANATAVNFTQFTFTAGQVTRERIDVTGRRLTEHLAGHFPLRYR